MKTGKLLFLLLLPSPLFAQYCIPTGDPYYGIKNLQINSIINYGSPVGDAYTYYPEEEFTTWLTIGNEYVVQVMTSDIGSGSCKIWIDLNNDTIFADNELLMDETLNNGDESSSITIPNNPSYIGLRRLRVMSGGSWGDFNPCGWDNYDDGEAEDYMVHITDSLVVTEYCQPLPLYYYAAHIENFEFNTLHNCQSGQVPDGYVEYPDSVFTTQVEIGESYPFYISNFTTIPGAGVTVSFVGYIDYNDNHTFESSERVIRRPGYEASGNIPIPNDSTLIGTHKMRIRAGRGEGATGGCTNLDGETEDYWIKIIAAVPDTDTIVPPPANRWWMLYDLPDKQWGMGVMESYDKGFLIMGSTSNMYNPYQLKISINGDTLWSKTYPSVEGRYPVGMDTTSDGGFIQCGQSYESIYQGGAYLMKANACGDMEWLMNYNLGVTDEYHWMEDVFQLEDGNYIVGTHYFSDSCTNWINRFGLAKIDTTGNVMWSKNYSHFGLHDSRKTLATSDGGYLINSYAFFPVPWDTIYWHVRDVLIKTDADGEVEWECVHDTVNHVKCYTVASVEITGKGYISTGLVIDSADRAVLSTFMTSSDGIMKWVKPVIEDDYWEYQPVSIKKVSDNLLVLLTERYNKCNYFDRRTQLFIIDTSGNVLNSYTAGGSKNTAGGICITSNGKILAVSTSLPGEYNSRIFATKYNTDLTFDTIYNVNLDYDSICDSIVPVHDIDPAQTIKFSIYPNPTNRFINLEVETGATNAAGDLTGLPGRESYSVSIFNAQGISIQRQDDCTASHMQFDLLKEKTGIYMVLIRKNDRVWSFKVVKAKG